MFTLIELLQSFIIAIVFILLFKLHRELFPNIYFTTSDIISDIENAPSRSSVVIRFLMILLLGVFSNFFVEDSKIILFGMTLGGFLIVWPIFLSDENIDCRFLDKKLILRALLAIFVAITYLTAKLSIATFNIGSEIIMIYLQSFNKERMINLIGDSLIWTMFIFISGFIYSYMRKALNKKLSISKNDFPDEIDMYSSHIEVTATEDTEVQKIEKPR